MYSPLTRIKTTCSLVILLPVVFSWRHAPAWFSGERRISEAVHFSHTHTFQKSSHLCWSLGR